MFVGVGTGLPVSKDRRESAPSSKTYAEWLAHAAARVTTVLTPADSLSMVPGLQIARVTFDATAVTKVGVGSPWMQLFSGNFEAAMFQSMPDAAQVAAQKANGGLIIFGWNGTYTSDTVPAVTRNGYTTSAHEVPGAPLTLCIVPEASYWDFTLNRPFTMNPFSASGPLEYAAPGW